MTSEKDLTMLRYGLRAVRSKLSLAGTRGLRYFEILPGFCLGSSGLFSTYCRLFAGPFYHCCGGCCMAPDDAPSTVGVVTSDLRVRGTEGLRIADASIMPHIPSGPIAATCAAIGIAAAQLIINDVDKRK